MSWRASVWVCAVVLVTGCGSWSLRRSASNEVPPPAPSSKPYDWREEGEIPAPPVVPAEAAGASLQEDFLAGDRLPERDSLGVGAMGGADFSVESLPAVEPPADLASQAHAASATMTGFRVQVFATRSRETAERLRDEWLQSSPLSAYLEFDDPYFKIRVGDCPTEKECRLLQEQLRNAGYPAAFIVPARIVAP
jgi:hypothetical protein